MDESAVKQKNEPSTKLSVPYGIDEPTHFDLIMDNSDDEGT